MKIEQPIFGPDKRIDLSQFLIKSAQSPHFINECFGVVEAGERLRSRQDGTFRFEGNSDSLRVLNTFSGMVFKGYGSHVYYPKFDQIAGNKSFGQAVFEGQYVGPIPFEAEKGQLGSIYLAQMHPDKDAEEQYLNENVIAIQVPGKEVLKIYYNHSSIWTFDGDKKLYASPEMLGGVSKILSEFCVALQDFKNPAHRDPFFPQNTSFRRRESTVTVRAVTSNGEPLL